MIELNRVSASLRLAERIGSRPSGGVGARIACPKVDGSSKRLPKQRNWTRKPQKAAVLAKAPQNAETAKPVASAKRGLLEQLRRKVPFSSKEILISIPESGNVQVYTRLLLILWGISSA